MVAGYDKRGPAIFKVDSEGQRVQLRLCSIGSGSLRCILHAFVGLFSSIFGGLQAFILNF